MNQALPSYPWHSDDSADESSSRRKRRQPVRLAPFTAIPEMVVLVTGSPDVDANAEEQTTIAAALTEAYPRVQIVRSSPEQAQNFDWAAAPSAIVIAQPVAGDIEFVSALAKKCPPTCLVLLVRDGSVIEWRQSRASVMTGRPFARSSESSESDSNPATAPEETSVPPAPRAEHLGHTIVSLLERRERVESRRRARFVQLHALRRENERLRRMCSEDPLTGLLNRRGFFKLLEMEFASAARSSEQIACVFIDVDFFKRLNDNYGHQAGDQALKQMGGLLRRCSRLSDIVGRIGGEEFCVALPGCDEFQAFRWAEKARSVIATTPFRIDGRNLYLTASFGVASCPAHRFEEFDLVDQADRALLVAKSSGRNRVVRAETMSQTVSVPQSAATNHAVRSLLAALTIRDPAVAHHSHRTAQFAIHLARHLGLLENELWVVEAAALLHDIGKLGLPDSILFKTDPLCGDERRQLEQSYRSGLDIVRAAFGDGPLTQALSGSRIWYRDRVGHDHYPLTGRIVAIADAFDAMTSPRPYRSTRDATQAFAEIQELAGSQFDPELVQAFIRCIGHST